MEEQFASEDDNQRVLLTMLPNWGSPVDVVEVSLHEKSPHSGFRHIDNKYGKIYI
jgi:hypothetical protein